MSNKVILHMSDLHFSSNPDEKKEKAHILDTLLEEIQSVEKAWRPQIVCVSGDIVDRHDVDAYPIAKEWFETLAEKLEIAKDHFVFTPGNHDCSRDIMEYPEIDTSNEEMVERVLGHAIPSYITGRFSAYEAFCKSLQVTPYVWASGENYLVGYRVIDDIVFWGCNTEWVAYKDTSKLRLGKNIVEELQQSTAEWKEYKKIAVMHHGTEDGFHENEIQYHNGLCPALPHLWRICHLALYGHSHEAVGGAPNRREDHCYTIKAGAASMNQKYPNNVNLLKVKEESFNLRYVEYNPKNVEHHWTVSEESKDFYWEERRHEKKQQNTPMKEIAHLHEKVAVYARDILDNKLRQVKLSGDLPETILRKVVLKRPHKENEQKETEESVELENILFAEKRVIVQGELGAGKSTILAQMVLEILSYGKQYLPLFIPAKELAKKNDGKVNSILEAMRCFIQEHLLCQADSFQDWLDGVECCYVFVDGLDEVDKKKQEGLLRVLEQLPLMEEKITVILSTRATETIEYHRDNWQQCYLDKLQQDEMFQLLCNEAAADGKGEQSAAYAKQCQEKINQNPMVQLVANTPLAVRLLYHILKKNEDLDMYTIGDLLNLLLEERVERWDEKNVSEVLEAEFERNFPTTDEKKTYIGYLAYFAEQNKITKRKLERMLCSDFGVQEQTSLLVEQTLAKLSRSGVAVLQEGQIAFVYRPLAQNAMGFYLATQILQGKLSAEEVSLDLWREISFAAGELRRSDMFEDYREWFAVYIQRLKAEAAGLTKGCYICYESKDTDLAIKMISLFREESMRPLWYYEEERTASLYIVAQTIALAEATGIDWFLESYLTFTYPVINMGSKFFSELYVVLAPLMRDKLSLEQKEKLQKCIEPLEYICPLAYIGLPEILCYLMPEAYTIERKAQLIAKLAYRQNYYLWVLNEYQKMCVDNPKVCSNALKEENSFAAARIWMELFEDEPDIHMVGIIVKAEEEEWVEICRSRLGQEKFLRYLRWLVTSSNAEIAAAAALQLCKDGQGNSIAVKKALVGGMINARKHNSYEKKITELIEQEGGLNKKWINILFNREHFVYGASEGCWRILLHFLVKSEEDLSEAFIRNIPFMGPFLLARCEETRVLLRCLLVKKEYKEALIRGMRSRNPKISHMASRIGLVACPDMEADCLYTVLCESTSENSDNMDWQRFVVQRKYKVSTLQRLREKFPAMSKSMQNMAQEILKSHEGSAKKDIHEMTKVEWITREIETESKYGIRNINAYINFLNQEVEYSLYTQLQEQFKNNMYAEQLLCFSYAEGRYQVDWQRLLWFVYVSHGKGFHDADLFSLGMIDYGKEHPEELDDILHVIKEICADERLEKYRWISQYHWLLLILHTFEGLEDAVIRDAFLGKSTYYGEESLALLSIYSGNLEELQLEKETKTKTHELTQPLEGDCTELLLTLAKEAEKIPQNLEQILQRYIQEVDEVDAAYIEHLIEMGENGTFIAGVICYCYGLSIPLQCGMISHQTYFQRGKTESDVFIKMLSVVRNAFDTQMQDTDELELYKQYLLDKEMHLEKEFIETNFFISEYLYYMDDSIETEKLIKFMEFVLGSRFADGYTSFIWKQIIPHIFSKNETDKQLLKQSMELAIYKVIGTYDEEMSYRFESGFELLVISCLYWYLSGEYSLLAQPVFEKGLVHLFYHQDRNAYWREDDIEQFFDDIEHMFQLLPSSVLNQALMQMQQSWLVEARIIGQTFFALLPEA